MFFLASGAPVQEPQGMSTRQIAEPFGGRPEMESGQAVAEVGVTTLPACPSTHHNG